MEVRTWVHNLGLIGLENIIWQQIIHAYFFFHFQIENSAQDFALYIIFATGGKKA